jgi:hypothetical protein
LVAPISGSGILWLTASQLTLLRSAFKEVQMERLPPEPLLRRCFSIVTFHAETIPPVAISQWRTKQLTPRRLRPNDHPEFSTRTRLSIANRHLGGCAPPNQAGSM